MPIGPYGERTFWQDWANLGLGLWLLVSPWPLGVEGAAAWNSWIMGVLVAGVSAAALIRFAAWEEWTLALAGVWLLVAPWVMGFAGADAAAALWNHVLVGLAVGVIALWDALAHATQDRMAA